VLGACDEGERWSWDTACIGFHICGVWIVCELCVCVYVCVCVFVNVRACVCTCVAVCECVVGRKD